MRTHDHIWREVLENPDEASIKAASDRAREYFALLWASEAGAMHFRVKRTVSHPCQWVLVALCEVVSDA